MFNLNPTVALNLELLYSLRNFTTNL